MTESGFTIDVDQNQFLPEGGRDVSAIVTVTSAADSAGFSGTGQPGGQQASAEIIIIDCSGSMEYPHTKIAEARAATAAAVDVIRDGTWFAVIAGTNLAWPVFPVDGSMAVAGAASRAAARQAVAGLRASGGTAIGQWLGLARQIFTGDPATLRHAILLTDGKNQHEAPEQLAAAPGAAGIPAASAEDVTVTMALTSRPPSGRYWFWSTSTVKPESVMTGFSSVTSSA